MFLSDNDKYIPQDVVSSYRDYLKSSGFSTPTVKNYLSDLRHLLIWIKVNYHEFSFALINEASLRSYRLHIKEKFRTKPSISARRLSSLNKFLHFAAGKNLVAKDLIKTFQQIVVESEKSVANVQAPPLFQTDAAASALVVEKSFGQRGKIETGKEVPKELHKKIAHHIRHTRPKWYKRYHEIDLAHTLHFLILVVYVLLVGSFLFYSFFLKPGIDTTRDELGNQIADLGDVLAATAPPSVLSFQGRLTDGSDVPVSISRDIVFTIYTAETAGSLLWTSKTWSLTPDQNGIFSVCLGNQTTTDDCITGKVPGDQDTAFPATLFTDNAALYLQVAVEGETLSPRQRISSVSYALNSDALDGFHGSQTPGANEVPILNASGNLIFLAAATVGSGGAGALTLDSDSGTLTLGAGTNTVVNADAATALLINPTGDLQFQSSSNTIDSSGNLAIAGTLDVNGGDGSDFAGGVTFNDDTDFVLGATENIYIDANTTTHTDTTGVIDLKVANNANGSVGFNFDYNWSGSTIGPFQAMKINLNMTYNAGSPYASGLYIDNLDTASDAYIYSLLMLDNSETAGSAMPNGLYIGSAAQGITNGIDVSDSDITNAINIGTNTILASGSFTLDLVNGSTSTLTIDNSGAGDPTVDLQGRLDVGNLASTYGNQALIDINGQVDNAGGACPIVSFGGCTGIFSKPIAHITGSEWLVGVSSRPGVDGSGTVTLTDAIGFLANNPYEGASDSITNAYGVYINNQTAGTNNYGVYIAGASTYALWVDANKVRLDEQVQIGDDTIVSNYDSGDLWVTNGSFCVDNGESGGGTDCDDASRASGYIYAESNSITLIDLAENYPSIQDLQPGEIVITDQNNPVYVERSTQPYQSGLLGIVSTAPGVLLGGFASDQYPKEILKPIALAGRVPTKVSTENGQINIGDPLTSSSTPGVAMKATRSGPVVGKALASFDCANSSTLSTPEVGGNTSGVSVGTCFGKIVVFVSVGWYMAPLEDTGKIESRLGSFTSLETFSLTAEEINIKSIKTESLEIGDHKFDLDSENNFVATISANTKFMWKNASGEVIGWINDTSEAFFEAIEVALADIGILTVKDEIKIAEDAQITGQAKFEPGDHEVEIASDKVSEDSLIYITPTTKTQGLTIYIKEIIPQEGFMVSLESQKIEDVDLGTPQATPSASKTIQFNWLIINQE